MEPNKLVRSDTEDSASRIRKRDLLRSFVQSKASVIKQEINNYYTASIPPPLPARSISPSIARSETQQIDDFIQESGPEPIQPQCLLFPTYACRLHDHDEDLKLYKIMLAGWAFAKPSSSRLDRFLLAAGRTYGGVTRNSAEDNHFSNLLNQFRCQTMRMIDIQLTVPGLIAQRFINDHLTQEQQAKLRDYTTLVNTGDSGRFQEEIIMNEEDLVKTRYLKLKANFIESEQTFSGYIDMIEPEGISIISDIDDTIKITNILDGKDAILQNTFFRKAKEVPHMSEVYRSWATEGAHFHYVSNSPWQVYPAIHDFLTSHKFPEGSIHLRNITTQQLIRGKRVGHKTETIRQIIKDFPCRKFILVGDSGEIDPEVYKEIYNEFPDQVFKIFIHDVSSHRAIETDRIAKTKPDSYYRMVSKFITRESDLRREGSSAELAIDAMAQTEIPEEQQDMIDPNIPLMTKLEEFEERMKRVSSGMKDGVYTVFTLASQLMLDPYVAEEFLMSKHK